MVPNQLTGLFHERDHSFPALGATSLLLPQRVSEHGRGAESRGWRRGQVQGRAVLPRRRPFACAYGGEGQVPPSLVWASIRERWRLPPRWDPIVC